MKAHKWLLLFHDHFECLANLYAVGDIVPSTKKIKIYGSGLKFFVSVF